MTKDNEEALLSLLNVIGGILILLGVVYLLWMI